MFELLKIFGSVLDFSRYPVLITGLAFPFLLTAWQINHENGCLPADKPVELLATNPLPGQLNTTYLLRASKDNLEIIPSLQVLTKENVVFAPELSRPSFQKELNRSYILKESFSPDMFSNGANVNALPVTLSINLQDDLKIEAKADAEGPFQLALGDGHKLKTSLGFETRTKNSKSKNKIEFVEDFLFSQFRCGSPFLFTGDKGSYNLEFRNPVDGAKLNKDMFENKTNQQDKADLTILAPIKPLDNSGKRFQIDFLVNDLPDGKDKGFSQLAIKADFDIYDTNGVKIPRRKALQAEQELEIRKKPIERLVVVGLDNNSKGISFINQPVTYRIEFNAKVKAEDITRWLKNEGLRNLAKKSPAPINWEMVQVSGNDQPFSKTYSFAVTPTDKGFVELKADKGKFSVMDKDTEKNLPYDEFMDKTPFEVKDIFALSLKNMKNPLPLINQDIKLTITSNRELDTAPGVNTGKLQVGVKDFEYRVNDNGTIQANVNLEKPGKYSIFIPKNSAWKVKAGETEIIKDDLMVQGALIVGYPWDPTFQVAPNEILVGQDFQIQVTSVPAIQVDAVAKAVFFKNIMNKKPPQFIGVKEDKLVFKALDDGIFDLWTVKEMELVDKIGHLASTGPVDKQHPLKVEIKKPKKYGTEIFIGLDTELFQKSVEAGDLKNWSQVFGQDSFFVLTKDGKLLPFPDYQKAQPKSRMEFSPQDLNAALKTLDEEFKQMNPKPEVLLGFFDNYNFDSIVFPINKLPDHLHPMIYGHQDPSEKAKTNQGFCKLAFDCKNQIPNVESIRNHVNKLKPK